MCKFSLLDNSSVRRYTFLRMIRDTLYEYSVFYKRDSEGGFVAFVPLLPGCHSQGETIEEAEGNIREAIEAYIESLRAH